MRVLIMADEKRVAGNIAGSLQESAGCAVDCAYDGEEGLYMSEWRDRRCCGR
jgi:DNA-binding response OmpR family regulator